MVTSTRETICRAEGKAKEEAREKGMSFFGCALEQLLSRACVVVGQGTSLLQL
jgi:hypothetical protein